MNEIVAFQASETVPRSTGTTTPGEGHRHRRLHNKSIIRKRPCRWAADGIGRPAISTGGSTDRPVVSATKHNSRSTLKAVTVTASRHGILRPGIFDLTGTVPGPSTSTALEAADHDGRSDRGASADLARGPRGHVRHAARMRRTTVPLGNGNVTTPPQAPTAGEHGHYYVDRMADGSFVITDQQSGNAMGYVKVSDGSYNRVQRPTSTSRVATTRFRTSGRFSSGRTDHRGRGPGRRMRTPNNDHFTVISIDGRASGGRQRWWSASGWYVQSPRGQHLRGLRGSTRDTGQGL